MSARAGEVPAGPGPAEGVDHVTASIAGQWLALPILRAHDVFLASELTRVPLAPPDVAGLVNLRGRVVTALDLRVAFGFPPLSPAPVRRVVVGVIHASESYGLVVDAVGEVMRLDPAGRHGLPAGLDGRWAALTRGVHRLPDRLVLELDVDAILAGSGPCGQPSPDHRGLAA